MCEDDHIYRLNGACRTYRKLRNMKPTPLNTLVLIPLVKLVKNVRRISNLVPDGCTRHTGGLFILLRIFCVVRHSRYRLWLLMHLSVSLHLYNWFKVPTHRVARAVLRTRGKTWVIFFGQTSDISACAISDPVPFSCPRVQNFNWLFTI